MLSVSPPMKKMLKLTGIVFGIIFGWYGITKLLFFWGMSHYVPPPVSVSSNVAATKVWQPYITSIGTLSAINGVDISAEVPGIVSEIHFTSGQVVNKGDVLVVLDTSVEQAQLKFDQAKLKLAQINYDRDLVLLKKNVVSQAKVDTDIAELQETSASVEADQAKIRQKTITSPFGGNIGIRQIDIGQYLQAGTTMVTLQTLDPLYVQFTLPEQDLPDLYPQQTVDITVDLSGQKTTLRGTINAINSKVDQTTRNILVEATIPNKNRQLLPGMFALVTVWLKTEKNVIVLPETSISYSLHGDSVFIIKKEGKDSDGKPILNAYRQYVKVGERRGDQVAIVSGIQPGDQVVTSGQLKLQNGTHVVIDNSITL
ncbi:MAG TPA: efflux RND transporter periplasmic adaptor subunit [Gammaproteobacteria bacterium]|nr:efflux RND transporter periplasmic adaptor subunit [Gammaproteobacteria bacterium]